jgi:hypothetical protein
MKKFLITEVEKSRILGMHYNAMGKTLVSEQVPPSQPNTPQKQPQAQVAGTEAATGAMQKQSKDVKSLLSQSPFLMPDQQDFESLKKDVIQVINTLKNPEYDVLKKYKLPVEYFPLYQIMYDVAVKWPELHDVPGPWPYTLKGFISKAGSEHNWKQRQANNAPKTQPTPQVAAATTTWSNKAMSDMAKSTKTQEEKMAAIQAEAAKVMADTTFLSPEKEKGQLDLDANTVNSILIYSSYLSEEQKMFLKRKISNLLKTKPEYKNEPFSLSINF